MVAVEVTKTKNKPIIIENQKYLVFTKEGELPEVAFEAWKEIWEYLAPCPNIAQPLIPSKFAFFEFVFLIFACLKSALAKLAFSKFALNISTSVKIA